MQSRVKRKEEREQRIEQVERGFGSRARHVLRMVDADVIHRY